MVEIPAIWTLTSYKWGWEAPIYKAIYSGYTHIYIW